MTVHIISVGVSLLEVFRHPAARLDEDGDYDLIDVLIDGRPLDHFARLPDAAAVSEQLATWSGESGDLTGAEALARTARKLNPGSWPTLISAELSTLAPGAKGFRLANGDMAVLIASDTRDGLIAALWNAVALTGADLGRVRYLPDPGMPLGTPETVRGHALVVRVPGMDAGNESGFREAMGGLGHLGRHLLGREELDYQPDHTRVTRVDEDFDIYLSGGFKAAIPYLIGLAEGIKSLHTRGVVRALVLHDTAGPQAGAISLPLRRLSPAVIRAELGQFGGRDQIYTQLARDSLLGYAYEKQNGGYTLTAFGCGLRALFGPPAETVG
jgi:hypothetical protein